MNNILVIWLTGAFTCDLSIVLIDSKKGLSKKTDRHSFISTLLGIKYLIITVYKIDLVFYKKNI